MSCRPFQTACICLFVYCTSFCNSNNDNWELSMMNAFNWKIIYECFKLTHCTALTQSHHMLCHFQNTNQIHFLQQFYALCFIAICNHHFRVNKRVLFFLSFFFSMNLIPSVIFHFTNDRCPHLSPNTLVFLPFF